MANMWVRRTIVIIGLLVGAAIGFIFGLYLTAPIVGWPHAVHGLLMDAPEETRSCVSAQASGSKSNRISWLEAASTSLWDRSV
jgi:hypothetical protein